MMEEIFMSNVIAYSDSFINTTLYIDDETEKYIGKENGLLIANHRNDSDWGLIVKVLCNYNALNVSYL